VTAPSCPGARTKVLRALDSSGFCKILIIVSALTWGFSFFVMKDATAEFPVFFLLAVRFGLASLVMLVVFGRRVIAHLDRRTIGVGVLLGVLEWAGYAFQTVGLTMTTPGKSAFLTGCYCVMVPFCAWALGLGRPERHNVIAAFVCVAGLGLVALDGGSLVNSGDLLTLVGAVFYALQMVEVSKHGPDCDVWAITTWQFIVMGVASAVSSAVLETPPPVSVYTPYNVFVLVFLAVVCSCVALAAINHAFTKVDPTAGALLSSLESPFGVAFSVMFAGEVLTGRLVAGFALIFLAIAFSEAGPQILSWRPGKGKGRSDS
jgi:drug/metabolite transporter (DMT)-like permease